MNCRWLMNGGIIHTQSREGMGYWKGFKKWKYWAQNEGTWWGIEGDRRWICGWLIGGEKGESWEYSSIVQEEYRALEGVQKAKILSLKWRQMVRNWRRYEEVNLWVVGISKHGPGRVCGTERGPKGENIEPIIKRIGQELREIWRGEYMNAT